MKLDWYAHFYLYFIQDFVFQIYFSFQDPGIDHFLALELIKDVQEKGGVVESYISYCGGLPAPEFSNNPLRYKFSWSPRAALANSLSAAKYLSHGQTVEILGGGDLMSAPKELNFLPGFALEGL